MAVVNDYVNSNVAAGKIGDLQDPRQVFQVYVEFEVAAADDNASVYRLLKEVNPDLILVMAEVWNDALTSGTDWDLGLYEPLAKGGAEIDGNIFADAMDLSSAHAYSAAGLFGMKDVNIDSVTKRLWEQAGHTILTKRPYDICLTANAVGSAAGTVLVKMTFIQGS